MSILLNDTKGGEIRCLMYIYKPYINIGPGNSQPIPSPFAVPDMMAKLHANPKTREFLNQPDYRAMIEKLRENPNDLK